MNNCYSIVRQLFFFGETKVKYCPPTTSLFPGRCLIFIAGIIWYFNAIRIFDASASFGQYLLARDLFLCTCLYSL